MRKSKAIELLSYMNDNNLELKRVEISKFFHTLNKSKSKSISGYYGTNIKELINNEMISLNKRTRKYKLTNKAKKGLKSKTLKPYSRFQTEREHYLFLKKEIKKREDDYYEMKSQRDEELSKYSFYWRDAKEDNYRMKVGTLINRLKSLKDDNAYIDISSDPEGNSFGDIADFKYENYAIFEGKFKDGKKVYSLMPRDSEQPENRYHGWDSYEEGSE
jgi:hypothetical protein